MIHRQWIQYACLWLLCGVWAVPVCAKDGNSLTKAFFHKGEISDKIVCYFAKEPLCNHMPRAKRPDGKDAVKEVRFFIPLTDITSEARAALARINNAEHEHYTIILDEVKKPLPGVQVVIGYDPKRIGFEYETFDAIHTHKGIVFKFHHTDMLHEMNKKTDHILRYAAHKAKVPTIIIDNGHGGTDAGKVGCHGVKEKDINLCVGSQVGKLLKKKGYKVVFTRPTDRFVGLDERTGLANKLKGDLFVSIHANGAAREAAAGIETFWAPNSLLKREACDIDEQSKEALAALVTRKDCASERLASAVHSHVLGQAKKFYAVKDRAVKESISQVLLGTDMPSALIEMGFLTNLEETKLLTQSAYQTAVAQGICNGIESYLKDV